MLGCYELTGIKQGARQVRIMKVIGALGPAGFCHADVRGITSVRRFMSFSLAVLFLSVSTEVIAEEACPEVASFAFFENADFDEVIACLSNGSDTLKPDGEGRTVLHFAAQTGDPTVIAPLVAARDEVEAGFDCSGLLSRNCTRPLHLAAARVDAYRFVAALLAAGASADVTDKDGNTPADLHRASGDIDPDVLALLAGADWPNRPSEPVPLADESQDCAQFLTKPFMVEAAPQDVAVCLAGGSRPRATNAEGNTALHLAAAWTNYPSIIELLLHDVGRSDAPAALSLTNLDGDTPLHMAVRHNSEPRVVGRLLAWGASVNALTAPRTGKRGTTPLHLAAIRQDALRWDIVALLLAHGADTVVQDDIGNMNGGRQALHYAAALSPDVGSVHMLLQAETRQRGISCRVFSCLIEDDRGLTALDLAALRDAGTGVLRPLLDFGFSPDAGDSNGVTALMRYAENGTSPHAFQLLLVFSRNPCIASDVGTTVSAYLRQNAALMSPDHTGNVVALEAFRQRCPG